jgi:6-hydroxycyclohex-1-ene-1-carbonyl-CoA dehydrogenase
MLVQTLQNNPLPPGEVLVRVVGCGVCHTDLAFFYEGVPTVKKAPLVLGHEVAGVVEAVGEGVALKRGQAVIVPAVLPCGTCELCLSGQGRICRAQKMPGNHMDGGFASHVVVPGRFLCPVPQGEGETLGDSGVGLPDLSVIADAVTTPLQAIENSGLARGDLAIFVGAGGIGGFGVQIARARGATVVALEVNPRRRALAAEHGASLVLDPSQEDPRTIKKAIQELVKKEDLPRTGWKIFETSGKPKGQELAFSLLTFGATLCVVGYATLPVSVRLSNLMAYDARAIGNWGCLPELYPVALDLVLSGAVKIAPYVERFPMSSIGEVFERFHRGELDRRPVLVPDFD